MKQVPCEQKMPYFSIIIPLYNRSDTIGRCLDSCLSQDFSDYEVIVVDDCSEDDSIAVVEKYLADPRVKLLRNMENRGVCASRGLGVKNSKGRWIMFIDSDDAFNPGAFRTIFEETMNAPQEVGEVRFCYFCEAIGKITPIPMMPDGILGFPEYLRWTESLSRLKKGRNSDLLYCQRREVYDLVSWPCDRQYETLFHIQVASKTKMIMCRKVVGTMFNDASNRISRTIPDMSKFIKIARDDANSKGEIIRDFGAELKKYSPRRYKLAIRDAGNLYLRCGEKIKGLRYLLKYILFRPFDIKAWGVIFFGLIGPKALFWAKNRFPKLTISRNARM